MTQPGISRKPQKGEAGYEEEEQGAVPSSNPTQDDEGQGEDEDATDDQAGHFQYPEQRHAGKVIGVGPEFGAANRVVRLPSFSLFSFLLLAFRNLRSMLPTDSLRPSPGLEGPDQGHRHAQARREAAREGAQDGRAEGEGEGGGGLTFSSPPGPQLMHKNIILQADKSDPFANAPDDKSTRRRIPQSRSGTGTRVPTTTTTTTTHRSTTPKTRTSNNSRTHKQVSTPHPSFFTFFNLA